MWRGALIQMTSGDDPEENLKAIDENIHRAASDDIDFIALPETANCISNSPSHQRSVLSNMDNDPTLLHICNMAKMYHVHILIGSLALKSNDDDNRLLNRSFLINPDGEIITFYDKIHMFDVTLSNEESYKESANYRPGSHAVTKNTPLGHFGLSICYDVRFAHLYRGLARRGAQILSVPAAFTVPTGQAHWEILLRARAIETGSFVIAPAQCGHHILSDGQIRKTYGHSMVIDPWGNILARACEVPQILYFDIDLNLVTSARNRIPALTQDQNFEYQ